MVSAKLSVSVVQHQWLSHCLAERTHTPAPFRREETAGEIPPPPHPTGHPGLSKPCPSPPGTGHESRNFAHRRDEASSEAIADVHRASPKPPLIEEARAAKGRNRTHNSRSHWPTKSTGYAP
jgi:hypothetical protein